MLEKRLQVFQKRYLRIILGVLYPTLILNVDLLQKMGQEDVAVKIAERKWRWIGHIARRDPGHLTKQSFEWKLEGTRRRARP